MFTNFNESPAFFIYPSENFSNLALPPLPVSFPARIISIPMAPEFITARNALYATRLKFIPRSNATAILLATILGSKLGSVTLWTSMAGLFTPNLSFSTSVNRLILLPFFPMINGGFSTYRVICVEKGVFCMFIPLYPALLNSLLRKLSTSDRIMPS